MTEPPPEDFIRPDELADRPEEDEGLDSRSTASSLTSITSTILEGKVGEGRRTYAVYGKEEYGFPMDGQELDRMDVCHVKYHALLNKKHFLSPITDTPHRILDLGCGTGIWSVDIADMFPSAEVVGVDIAPTQPDWVPPNCHFELDDIEQPWTWQENIADFIFSRDLILAIRDFPKLIDQSYRHLKPGGWLEFHCVTGVLCSDDNSIPKDSKFQAFSDNLSAACVKFGTPVDDPARWKGWFEARGFEDVEQTIFKLPCTPWPKDQRLKLLGMWEQQSLLENLEGLTMRLFVQGLGWTEEEVLVFAALVRKDLRNLALHGYWPFYVVRGRKPVAKDTSGDKSD